jgi:hypothetical protein
MAARVTDREEHDRRALSKGRRIVMRVDTRSPMLREFPGGGPGSAPRMLVVVVTLVSALIVLSAVAAITVILVAIAEQYIP